VKIEKIVVSPRFQTNCYLLSCERSREAIVIDAGAEPEKILQRVEAARLDLKYLINTHAHVDHVAGVAAIKRLKGVPFFLHQRELEILEMVPQMLAFWRMPPIELPSVDEYIEAEREYSFGDCSFRILETPGHSPGSVCFLFPEHVFVGDTLFCQGIARTDIPHSSLPQLLESIRTQLLTLDEQMVVHTGHGAVTSIGLEKLANPFLH